MPTLLNSTLLLIGLFCSSIHSLWGQEKKPIQQELGIVIGLGMSGEMDIEDYNSMAEYTPHVSTSFSLSYNVLLLQERLNVGIGLGFQTKASGRTYGSPLMDIIGPTFSSDQQQAFTLPIAVGYRLKVAPKHSLLVDALVIPFWTAFAASTHDPGDSPIGHYPYDGGFNLDFGVQLGYQVQLSKRLSGQVAFRGTVSPFNASTSDNITHVSTEYYTLRLQVGLRYRLGKTTL
ncbi:MAG: hypothetical protein ACRBFS_03260 [Aureispira sp.]